MKSLSYIGYFVTIIFLADLNTEAIQPTEGRFNPTTVVYQLFEMVRRLVKLGDANKNVPALDPYVFDRKQIVLDKILYGCIKGQMNISRGIFTGLGAFVVEKQEFIKYDVAIQVVIRFPKLTFRAEYYKMDGAIWEAIPITGKGTLNFEIDDVHLKSKIYLKQSSHGKSILVDKFQNTSFTIERILSHTDFDGTFDDILNSWVEDSLADYLTRFSGYLAATYAEEFVKTFNILLEDYETWNILATIL